MQFNSVGKDLAAWAKTISSQLSQVLAGVNSADDLILDVGVVFWIAGTLIPKSCVECNGQLLLIDAYPDLFAQIGTQYNTGGEPITNFRVPNVVAKTPTGLWPVIRAVGKRSTDRPLGSRGTA